MPCHVCEPFGGFWIKTETGMNRCTCEDGRRLASQDEGRKNQISEPPRLSREAVIGYVEMLAAMPFFPTAEGAQLLISEEIRSMCRYEQEGLWLVKRICRLYDKWPGLRELRLVYCSKHRPLDGVELLGSSDIFPEGIPSENPQLPPPEFKRLAPGEAVSAAPSIDLTVRALAEAKSITNAGRRASVPDIPELSPGYRISQTDIEAAVIELRMRTEREEQEALDRAAREELGL